MVSMELTVFDGSNLEVAQLLHLHLKKETEKKGISDESSKLLPFFFRTFVAT